MPKGRVAQDWTGLIFNNCKIIEPITRKVGYVKWKILCHCGNIFEAEPSKLKQGQYQSCGCYRIKASKERMIKQKLWIQQKKIYVGNNYNGCIVLNSINQNKDSMHDYFNIKCHCGNLFKARISNLHSGSIKSCGCLKSGKGLKEYHIKNKQQKGLDPNLYYTERMQLLRNLFFTKDIKNIILLRDNYKCCHCDSSENLFIHHIFPICHIYNSNKFSTLYQIYSIDNLITLCSKCHQKAHLHNSYNGKIDLTLQDKFTNYIFDKNINFKNYEEYNQIKQKLDNKLKDFLIGKII